MISQFIVGVIAWEHWINLYAFSGNEAISIATKFTAEHISLTTRTKMKSHLAKEVIDRNALDAFKVMQSYQQMFAFVEKEIG